MNPMLSMNTLKTIPRRTWSFVRSHVKTSIAVGILVLVGIVLIMGGDKDALAKKTVRAHVGDVVQEVSVTGRVKASQTADLSFERSSRITGVYVDVGSKVRQGQTLVQLDTSELSAQRQQTLASITVAESGIAAAQRSLRETTSTVVAAMENTLITFTDVQYTYFNNTNPESLPVADAKDRALEALYGQSGLGRVQSWYFLRLKPVLETALDADTTNVRITDISHDAHATLVLTAQALDVMTGALSNISASATDKATITAARNSVQGQMTALVASQNALVSAQAQFDQAKTSIASIDAQIAKYALYAPFTGVVTTLEAKRGEIAGPGVVAVSVMNTAKFEIEATIAEADIAKVHVGDAARVKLDAYGSDVSFPAQVMHIDPAGRILEGVATYRVTFQFTQSDNRVLAGLTADIDVQTDQRDNVVFVPTRNITTKDGQKFVRVLVRKDDTDTRFANLSIISESEAEKVVDVPVTIGLRGSDGRTEIISGIHDGDLVVAD